jgi:hypothetical protein
MGYFMVALCIGGSVEKTTDDAKTARPHWVFFLTLQCQCGFYEMWNWSEL